MKHHLYIFWLFGNVKNWDEDIWDLLLFVQKTQIEDDAFKLHKIVARKKNVTAVWNHPPNNIVSFSISHKVYNLKFYSIKICPKVKVFFHACQHWGHTMWMYFFWFSLNVVVNGFKKLLSPKKNYFKNILSITDVVTLVNMVAILEFLLNKKTS